MRYEVRLSPDGERVAIRNLNRSASPASGPSWVVTSGSWYTDEQVADWTVLQPGPSVVVKARKVGDYFDVDINGKLAARRVASLIAGEFAIQAALQKGEPVMLVATEVAGVTPLTRPKLVAVPAVEELLIADAAAVDREMDSFDCEAGLQRVLAALDEVDSPKSGG